MNSGGNEDSPKKKKPKKKDENNRVCIIHNYDVEENVSAFSKQSWQVRNVQYLFLYCLV